MQRDTHNTFRSRVNYSYKHEADGEPLLRVLHVEIAEAHDAGLLDREDAADADRRLDCEEEEVHVEAGAGDDEGGAVFWEECISVA